MKKIVVSYRDFYMPLVRCHEEAEYSRRLGDLVHSSEEAANSAMVHKDFVVLDKPYDELWFMNRFSYWWKGCDYETRARKNTRRTKLFAGWNNTEFFAVPTYFS